MCGVLVGLAWDHADGALCCANVPRPAASSFISRNRVRHRHGLVGRCLIGHHTTAYPVPRAPGGLRSEIKEEAQPGDIRGGGCPVFLARVPGGSRNSILEN